METFIVLGFCFILYEALDFFQSCYSNNNKHHQQHLQLSEDIFTHNTRETADSNDESATNLLNVINSVPLSDENHVKLNSGFDLANSSHSNYETDNSVDFESLGAYDSEKENTNNNQSNQNIFSICDRVNNLNREHMIEYQSEAQNSNVNSFDK